MKYRLVSLLLVGWLLSGTSVHAQWHCAWDGGQMNATVKALFSSGSNLYFAPLGKYVYRSSDNGATWDSSSVSPNPQSYILYTFNAMAVSGTTLLAGSGSGIFRSTDNGTTWAMADSGLTNLDVRALAVSGTDVFAGTWGGGLFRSTDGGISWSKVTSGMTSLYIATLFVDGAKMYAGCSNGGAFVSTTGGTSWGTIYNFPYTTYVINAFGRSGSIVYSGSGSGLYRSTDNGVSWTTVSSSSGFADSYGMAPGVYAFAPKDSAMFVGTSGGIFLSSDHGVTWSNVTAPSSLYSMSLAVSGPYLYAGVYYSDQVWRRPLADMVTAVEHGSPVIPGRVSLEQNYPNPFNPSTTISYALSHSATVTLKIYSVLGREVATLVSAVQPSGTHTVRWNADAMAAGVYFYQLRTDNEVLTRKLVLVK